MARIYIANCTNQHRQIAYRLDYTVDPHGNRVNTGLLPYKTENIPPGRQLPIGGDLPGDALEEIVKQLTPYGLVAMLEMKRAQVRGPTPMVFNIDKPVPRAVMDDAQHHNAGILSVAGKARREAAAIASNQALADTVAGQGFPDVKEPGKFEVEFEQTNRDDNYADANLIDGLRVVRRHTQPPPEKAPRRRRTTGSSRAAA